DRQVAPDAEVARGEDADPVLELEERVDQAAAALLRYVVEEEVREGEARECARVVEVAEDPLVAGVGEALALVEPPAPEPELVPALEDRELVGELIGVDVVEFRDAS